MIDLKKVNKSYHDKRVVKDVDVSIHDQRLTAFIGPNGAGKSTTIRSIMNVINKSYGEVYFNDQLLDKNNIEAKKLIGYLPSEVFLYEDMSVKQMLDYHASFFKEDLSERRKELVKDVKKKGEASKVAIRNIRRDGNDAFKKLKGSDVSEDEIKDMEEDLQKLTDKFVKEVDKAVEVKSKEVMTV